MKCPICNNPRIRYNTKLTKTKTREGKKLSVRTDFNVTCKCCKWKGEINSYEYNRNINKNGDERKNV